MLDHALRVQPWTEVVAVVRPANAAAIRVLQKLGFSLEAEARINGEDAILFQADRHRVYASHATDVALDPSGRFSGETN